MRHKLLAGMLAWVCCALVACSSQEEDIPLLPIDPEQPPVAKIEQVSVKAKDILSGNARDTRTAFELESTKLTFKWAEGDRIGIFPLGVEGQNDQVSLTIRSGAGTNQATFSGGGWALRTDMTYAAYYPYQLSSAEQAVTDTEILFSYEHQCQTGNATLTHLGKHDFMATVGTVAANRSQGTEAPEDWVLNFDFFHMNCVAQFNLVLPKAVAVDKLSLRCDDPIFWQKGRLNLTGGFMPAEGDTPVFDYAMQGDAVRVMEMELKEIGTTEQNKTLTLYMNLPPVDMQGHQVYVVLHGTDNRVYQGLLPSKAMVSGNAYRFDATLQDVTVSSDIDSPPFSPEEI